MCLVSERGQTRAWIFITCTATRWRRPIHQAELSRWSQTFPIKTPPSSTHHHHHHHLAIALRKQEVHPHGRKEREESVKERGELFCTVMNFKIRTPHPQVWQPRRGSIFLSLVLFCSFSELDLAYF